MLESDIRLDNVRTFNAFIPGVDLKVFNDTIREVEAQSLGELLQEGVERERARLLRFLDVRYLGQHHEVTVECPADVVIEEKHLDTIARSFHKAHERLYTYSTPENPLEIMNLRITAVGAVDKAGFESGDTAPGSRAGGGTGAETGTQGAKDSLKGSRSVYFAEAGGFQDTPVHDRSRLRSGMVIPGPAVIEERITTVIVHPGWTAAVDGYGNVVMEVIQ
jgi:N-methylhydantoinase A